MKRVQLLIIISLLFTAGCSITIMKTPIATLSEEQVRQMAQSTIDAMNAPTAASGFIIQPIVKATSTQVPVQPTDLPVIFKPTAIPTQAMLPTIRIPELKPTTNYAAPVSTVCDRVRFLEDITIPDNTLLRPGQIFRKVWRIQNAGSCAWSAGYQLVFAGGDAMGPTYAVNLPGMVPSGATVDVSVDMVAPLTSGAYQSNWKLRSTSGNVFGTANATNDAIWTKIVVGTSANVATVAPGVQVMNSGCSVISVVPAYKASFPRDFETDFEIKVMNTGNSVWTADTMDLAFIGGENMLKRKDQIRRDLPYDVAPGSTFYMALDAKMPSNIGIYTMSIGVVSGYEVLCTMNITVNVIN